CNVRSAGELDGPGRQRYLAHLKKLGFRLTRKSNSGTGRTLAHDAESRKIRSLWLTLHELGAVRNPSEDALAAYVKRTVHVDALQWLNGRQAEVVIESMKKWAMRYLPDRVRELAAQFQQAGKPGETAAHDVQAALVRATQYPSFDPMVNAWEALREALSDKSGGDHVA
ncbi:regulatory protein GemA, partial [Paraburkholderia fungorum]|uniref:regulatory protein GemA n=1 Tax=Paraburkholderia fungorum TaxID=134537 RepID=UPI00402BB9E3